MCDARSGVRFDDQGFPLGIDEAVLPDLDAMLAAAGRHQVRLIPVLLDFHLCGAPRVVNGVQLGGRSRLIIDSDARTALVDRVLQPIVERCATDDSVIAWDIFNEPEWCLRRRPRTVSGAVSFDALQRFLGQAVECVQSLARQPVTVGCAGTWRLDLVTPLSLDFYQVHWYDRFGWSALSKPIAELGLPDRPVVLGEFSGRTAQVADVLDTARKAGYEGAFVWSLLAEDEQSDYPVALREWVRAQAANADETDEPRRGE